MAHEIMENDKGAVGFVQQYGQTWHKMEQYKHFEECIPFEYVEHILSWQVEKKPLFVAGADGTFQKLEKKYALARQDTGEILYAPVTDVYSIYQNSEMMKFIYEAIIKPFSMELESAGSLKNGRHVFANIILMEETIDGDISPTKTRLMIDNTHGAKALSTCLHQTRIVCNNTLRMAKAQGTANSTFKKFRHSKSMINIIEEYAVDLTDLIAESRKTYQAMNDLASEKINEKYQDQFFDNFLQVDKLKGRAKTIAQSQMQGIKTLYDSKEDLKPLPDTRYKLLNAVTDYYDHKYKKKEASIIDAVKGKRDEMKQQALSVLTNC